MRRRKKVLLIDDDRGVLELLKVQIERRGRDVVTTDHPASALRIVKEEKPDLIVCDIRMSERSGDGVAKDLAADPSAKDIPFLFLTGVIQPEEVKDNGTVAGVWVMSKSSPHEEILARIDLLLDWRAAID